MDCKPSYTFFFHASVVTSDYNFPELITHPKIPGDNVNFVYSTVPDSDNRIVFRFLFFFAITDVSGLYLKLTLTQYLSHI